MVKDKNSQKGSTEISEKHIQPPSSEHKKMGEEKKANSFSCIQPTHPPASQPYKWWKTRL